MDIIAVLTWLLVAYAAVMTEIQRRTPQPWWHTTLIIVVLLIFLLAMWHTIRSDLHDHRKTVWLIPLQFVLVLALTFLVPNNGMIVLAIITSSQLPWLLTLRPAVVAIAIFMLLHTAIQKWWWQDNSVWFEALLYGAFHLFAFTALNSVKNERDAKENLVRVNAELNATQQLLSQAARQSERLNISRNLHDVLGHHLTALSIQLEIAGHLSTGDAKTQVQKAQQLAKLLLSDVRSAVSELRDEAAIDLPSALLALVSAVPRLQVNYRWPDHWRVDDLAIADAVLRIVQEGLTNILRHSHANRCDLNIEVDETAIEMVLSDNGGKPKSLIEGNGLRGMRERVQALSGQMSINANDQGVTLQLRLPVPTP